MKIMIIMIIMILLINMILMRYNGNCDNIEDNVGVGTAVGYDDDAAAHFDEEC